MNRRSDRFFSYPLPASSEQHELATLRTLQSLPREVLDRFEPRQPPPHISRYVQQAPQGELQWVLLDVLHRLHVLRAQEDTRRRFPGNGEGTDHE